MIKRAIKNISEAYGKKLFYKGEVYYSFPKIEDLKDVTEEQFKSLGVGFRCKYIYETVQKLLGEKESEQNFSLEYIETLEDQKCHEAMQVFSGIGPKVSDCIILFSMRKYSSFPVDVWVKRAMQHFYLAPDVSLKKIRIFGIDKFGELSGFAQQYLFYYARENKIEV